MSVAVDVTEDTRSPVITLKENAKPKVNKAFAAIYGKEKNFSKMY